MDIINWLQLSTNIILVIITGIYAYYTKQILDSSLNEVKLLSNPIIGINIDEIYISKVYGEKRRNLVVNLSIVNIGNDPAIDILVDAEIVLEYSDIKGEKNIPAVLGVNSIPFAKAGEEINEIGLNPSFGNTLISHLFDDFNESYRLNDYRINTNPSQDPYNASKLILYVYYHNNLGQYFKGEYILQLDMDKIPKDDEVGKVNIIYVPRPIFRTYPITKDNLENEIKKRDEKRELGGW